MTIPSQVFLLFYAVLYGALFTITDKWRPLMGVFGPKGRNRLVLSVILYGLAPVLYFLRAFRQLQGVRAPTYFNLLLSIYSVVPLVFFHFCWIWVVVPNVGRFYEDRHLKDTTLDAVITWTRVGDYTKPIFVLLSFLLLLGLPLLIIFVLPLLQGSNP